MNSRDCVRIYREYGKSAGKQCRQCCNYQLRKRGEPQYICIAYSNTSVWNGAYTACEKMFNIPFRGIRPRILPLEEMLEERTDIECLKGQVCLFDEVPGGSI